MTFIRHHLEQGRDSIDHPPGQHDDIANAVAGALTLQGFNYLEMWGRW
jgi:hypothetical protein